MHQLHIQQVEIPVWHDFFPVLVFHLFLVILLLFPLCCLHGVLCLFPDLPVEMMTSSKIYGIFPGEGLGGVEDGAAVQLPGQNPLRPKVTAPPLVPRPRASANNSFERRLNEHGNLLRRITNEVWDDPDIPDGNYF